MPDDRYTPKATEAGRQVRKLVALLDQAGDELERDGPLPPAELRRRLEALEAVWAGEQESGLEVGKPRRRPR